MRLMWSPRGRPAHPVRHPRRVRLTHDTAGAAHDDLVRYAAGGPHAVAEWLDTLASTQDAPVISLAERRGRGL